MAASNLRSGSTSGKTAKNNNPRLSDANLKSGKLSTDERLDEICVVLASLKDDMRSQIRALGDEMKAENRDLVERLESRVMDLELRNDVLNKKVTLLEQQVIDLKENQRKQEWVDNDIEQQGRKNSIRIIGLEDKNRNETVEQSVEKIVNFVKNKLKVPITEADIDTAHRLGPYTGQRPRNLICKFTHRRKKMEIIRNRKILKKSGIVITEDLTRINQQRLKLAYELPCVEKSWSMEGKLFALLKNGKKRQLLYTTELTEEFLTNDRNFPRSF
ncbi:uncharacterized protein LOC117327576 [Pecten maximus]|uniref:uncharacterized protein LOC117327576 n=1 Tax=Pecten maximus TaxID=6579 RepID=UPI001458C3B2|nr:uncharacterized protein LOC117327576 [Pecten maximus]